ncbi:hypothetical protein J7643_16330 [bacterium]|nr:hypothetical protein [bacterium]
MKLSAHIFAAVSVIVIVSACSQTNMANDQTIRQDVVVESIRVSTLSVQVGSPVDLTVTGTLPYSQFSISSVGVTVNEQSRIASIHATAEATVPSGGGLSPATKPFEATVSFVPASTGDYKIAAASGSATASVLVTP